MNNKIYWIWLQNALKYGSHKVRTINLLYENIQKFYNAREKEWRLCGCFTNKEISSLLESTVQKAAAILDRSVSLGYQIITLEDKDYPQKLKSIVNPPCVLYINGDISNIDKKLCVSIVGTRNATLYGMQTAFEMAYNLAKEGVIIISGGALGIDRSAHSGALRAGGETMAVLGCGINCKYLAENGPLRREISKTGALISEYPPDLPAFFSNFPIRNRIISGLSSGTVVIEAGAKSGSLITANLASSQYRDVFAVPVGKESPVSQGTFSLIRGGAKVVTCAQDILNEYNIKGKNINFQKEKEETINSCYKPVIAKPAANKNAAPEIKFAYNNESAVDSLSEECKNVYLSIKKTGKSHIDQISVNTNIHIKNLLSIITQLEICGFIKSYPGKMYAAKQ
ncbi:MAG: DNA-processing protein DprA [Oscillospiraceae bacterium]|nr:DNA-processing protein DprA [Oscillospiraceae bacterium]